MSLSEANKATILNRVVEGDITAEKAAARLGISKRHVFRLKAKIRQDGISGLSHGNRGKRPANAITDEIKATVLEKGRGEYRGASFSHMAELLERRDGVKISPKSVGRILKEAGVYNPHRRRPRKKYRSRARRERQGELVQIDASPFDWLETGESWSLHGAIDDATGDVIALRFEKEECSAGYLHVLEQMLKTRGIPGAIYSDRHTIFFSPAKEDELSEEDILEGRKAPLTQYGKTLYLLGIEHIPARTPQAKGRIERLWGTLQHRLLLEMRVAGVKTMEEANAFLPVYMELHNSRFAMRAAEDTTAFYPCPEPEKLNLILGRRDERKASGGSEISWHNNRYQLAEEGGKTLLLRRGERITVIQARDGIMYGIREEADRDAVYRLILSPVQSGKKEMVKKKEAAKKKPVAPSADHPWRGSWDRELHRRFCYDDLDTMERFEDIPLIIGGVKVS